MCSNSGEVDKEQLIGEAIICNSCQVAGEMVNGLPLDHCQSLQADEWLDFTTCLQQVAGRHYKVWDILHSSH